MEKEVITKFTEGPYDILNYEVYEKGGKVFIEVNEGEFGRLPIEDLKTVEDLREVLNQVEERLMEAERRKEEL